MRVAQTGRGRQAPTLPQIGADDGTETDAAGAKVLEDNEYNTLVQKYLTDL